MALRKEEKAWVAEEIRVAIRERLDPHGWKKLQSFLPTIGVLSVMVALLAFAGAGWKYAFSKVEAEATFQTKTTGRLEAIDSSLKELKKRAG